MRRHSIPVLLAGAVVVTAALALTGCSAQSGSGGSRAAGGSDASSSAPQKAQGTAQDLAKGSAATVESPSQRDTVVTGSVALTVDAPVTAAARVASLAASAGGRVDARSEQAATRDVPAHASLTIRVPSSRVDRVIADLKGLGRDAKVTTRADDVTAVHQDTAARIDALETSIARLTQFVSTASKTDDLIQLESEITQRQAELESLQAQQRGLDDQIALATLEVQLSAPTAAVRPAPGDFGSGVVIGWAAFTAFLGWLAVAFGVALPWLGIAALVLAAIWGIRRMRRRSHGATPTT